MEEINNDELRRELRDLDKEHREVMPRWRDSLMRLLVDDKETPTEAKADFILGGFNRRRFMRMSGLAVVGGTVLAACGSDKKKDAGATDRQHGGGHHGHHRGVRAPARPTRRSPAPPPRWRTSPWRSTTRRS